MKIDIEEIKKVNKALDSIDGWDIEDFKVWETQSGKNMATIRLRQKKKEKPEAEKTNGDGTGAMSATMNISNPSYDY